MFIFLPLVVYISLSTANDPVNQTQFTKTPAPGRRILNGVEVGETRPYMVYLRRAPRLEVLPQGLKEDKTEMDWLCGGVIIDKQYILTSAACIADVKNFYVISGTHRWVPGNESYDECVNNGKMRAIWKCAPQNFVFDGGNFDNFQWMRLDIAVVKVEEVFNFKRRVKGCDFIPKKISFNNASEEFEKPGTAGTIVGWGSTYGYKKNPTSLRTVNSPALLEAEVTIVPRNVCKAAWDERYHHIIDNGVICTKDASADDTSALCKENQAQCEEILPDELSGQVKRSFILKPQNLRVHTAANHTRKSAHVQLQGGFCENDHGGPLIVGRGPSAMVVGIITACLTKEKTGKCHGPFLYTSVWQNRYLIMCAIQKDYGDTCKRVLRTMNTEMVETTYNWRPHKHETYNVARTINHKTKTGRSQKHKNKNQPMMIIY